MSAFENDISKHIKDALIELIGDEYIDRWQKKDMHTSMIKHVFRRKMIARYNLAIPEYAAYEAFVMGQNRRLQKSDIVISICRAGSADSTTKALVHDAIDDTSQLTPY